MPLIQPNLSEVKALEAISPGVYPAKIIAVETKTSQKGNPMIVVKLDITVDGVERTRSSYLVITGAGAFNFEQLLRACNFNDLADAYKDPSVTDKPPFDTDDLVGQELNVQVESDTYNGNITDKIAGFLRR